MHIQNATNFATKNIKRNTSIVKIVKEAHNQLESYQLMDYLILGIVIVGYSPPPQPPNSMHNHYKILPFKEDLSAWRWWIIRELQEASLEYFCCMF